MNSEHPLQEQKTSAITSTSRRSSSQNRQPAGASEQIEPAKTSGLTSKTTKKSEQSERKFVTRDMSPHNGVIKYCFNLFFEGLRVLVCIFGICVLVYATALGMGFQI